MNGAHELDGRDPAVQAQLRALRATAEQHDGVAAISDQALLAVAQGTRRVFAFDNAMGVIGEGELDLVVRPEARGSGRGTAALAVLLATHDAHGGELRAWAHGENPAAQALLRRAGFAPVRTLLRLALDPARLPEAIAAARPLPTGYRLTAFTPGNDAQVADWVCVNAAAFAHHPEQGRMSADDFLALTAEDWFDPDDLLLAYDGDTLAGYGWVKTVHSDATVETELYALGVDPAYAGRGLGAALLGATLRRMARRDPHRITLYVDGDNTSARALYDRAGFTLDQSSTQWLRGTAENARMSV